MEGQRRPLQISVFGHPSIFGLQLPSKDRIRKLRTGRRYADICPGFWDPCFLAAQSFLDTHHTAHTQWDVSLQKGLRSMPRQTLQREHEHLVMCSASSSPSSSSSSAPSAWGWIWIPNSRFLTSFSIFSLFFSAFSVAILVLFCENADLGFCLICRVLAVAQWGKQRQHSSREQDQRISWSKYVCTLIGFPLSTTGRSCRKIARKMSRKKKDYNSSAAQMIIFAFARNTA